MLRLMEAARPTLRGTDESDLDSQEETRRPRPGLVAIFSGRTPQWMLIPIPISEKEPDGLACGEVELGREILGSAMDDGRISRRHARVSYLNGAFSAADLGSLNGTWIDGRPASADLLRPLHRCLRVGDTLLLPVADLQPFELAKPMVRAGVVIGPSLFRLYQRLGNIAAASVTLHITGESGSGKENAARAFHSSSPASHGPFVGVNCATIPEGIAERLLFGARKGAFSGVVADSEGYIQAAHQGTLFLDEVAELHAAVQAKLLRVLETREVLAVGAVRPQPVDLRICSASHRSLSAEVAAGRLREDLYYRIGRPSERVPPLRERPEEIPWLIQTELKKGHPSLSAHVSLVEACIVRHWPGNIRELLVEIRAAAHEATTAGSGRIKAEHLATAAGQNLKEPSPERAPAAGEAREPGGQKQRAASPARQSKCTAELPNRARIVAALLEAKCNVSEAARRLGMHRNQLRRRITQHSIDLDRLRLLAE